MLFANVDHWTSAIESPNLDVRLLVFDEMSREYERLTFRPAELEIPQQKNNTPAFHNRIFSHEKAYKAQKQQNVLRTISLCFLCLFVAKTSDVRLVLFRFDRSLRTCLVLLPRHGAARNEHDCNAKP